MKKPTCIVVDAYSSGTLVGGELRARGIEAVHVQSWSKHPPFVSNSFIADDFSKNIIHEGNLEETLREVKKIDPLAIIIGAESGVELWDQLCDSLGFPGNDVETSQARRDKFVMVEALKKKKIPSVEHFKSHDWDQVSGWVKSLGFPVVLKPVSGAGTDGVSVCRGEGELRTAFDVVIGKRNKIGLVNREILVQSFLDGVEYIVDTVSMDGEVFVTDICQYIKVKANNRQGIYESVRLMEPDGQLQDQLVAYFKKVLEAVGIRNGPAHGEIMMTAEGPVLVEVGARYPGGGWPEIAGLCTGWGQIQATVDRYIDPHAFLKHNKFYRLKKQARLVFLISEREGLIRELPEFSPEEFPSLHSVYWLCSKNTNLGQTIDVHTTPAMIALVHEDPNVIEADHKKIRHWEKRGFYDEMLGEG